MHWLPSDQTEDLAAIGIHLLSCRQNLLLEEMLFHTEGKEMREPPNVRIKLISERHNDPLWIPVITAIRMSDSSLAPACKGMWVSNLSHLPHFCRKSCISSHSPGPLGGGCTRGHHSQTQANTVCEHSRLCRASWYRFAQRPWVKFTSELQL